MVKMHRKKLCDRKQHRRRQRHDRNNEKKITTTQDTNSLELFSEKFKRFGWDHGNCPRSSNCLYHVKYSSKCVWNSRAVSRKTVAFFVSSTQQGCFICFFSVITIVDIVTVVCARTKAERGTTWLLLNFVWIWIHVYEMEMPKCDELEQWNCNEYAQKRCERPPSSCFGAKERAWRSVEMLVVVHGCTEQWR